MTTSSDRLWLRLTLVLCCWAPSADAQAPTATEAVGDAGVPAASLEAEDAKAPTIEELREQTKRIRQLMVGRLDVAVDPQTLFTVDLGAPKANPDLDLLLRELEQDARREGRQSSRERVLRTRGSEDALGKAHRELVEAQAAFLSLPRSEREAILSKHEARRREAEAQASSAQAKAEMLVKLEEQIAQLDAFLVGDLDPSIDPRPLLEIDPAELTDLAADPERRRRFLDPSSRGPIPAAAKDDVDGQLNAAKQRRDMLWIQFLELDDAERRRLLSKHAESRVEPSEALAEQISGAEQAAKDAALEREVALVDSQEAKTESLRLIADRRAQLLSVKEAQARFKAELASSRAKVEAKTESALAWNRRVRELRSAMPSGEARANQADHLYRGLTKDLGDARHDLSLALDAVRSEPSGVPLPPNADDDQLPADIDDGATRELRTALSSSAIELQALEAQLNWDRAEALRDAIVIMNRARLRLFEMLSESRRDSLEGFGPDGVAQVKRELDQIILEVRFHLLVVPREAARQYRQLRSSPGPVVFSLVQLLLLVLVFRWWRKRADDTLEQSRRAWLQKRPQTHLTRGVSTFVWYLRRIRKPLEWLALFSVLTMLVAKAGHLPETKYVQIVVLWLLAGAFVVELIDATASRQGFSSESSAKLRFRSLRLVGVSIVAVGLILSLTVATVGKGAIYAWVVSTFGFLAIPVFLVLIVWWKDTIFERAKGREASAVLKWVVRHDHGLLTYPAATVGGVYLLIEGVAGFVVRRVSDLAPLRRVFAYLFRRGVEKNKTATPAEYGTEPIPADVYGALAPHPETPPELLTSYMSESVHAMRALVRSERHAIVALVGERGLGKTTFLNRVTSDLEPGSLCAVQCQPGGFAALLVEFARALGLPETASEDEVIASLGERAPSVIRVDDAQRLVRPLIGGLKAIDQLVQLTRSVSPQTSWLIAIGMPAWQYLRRARGDRAAFDQVIELQPWEENQIASLIEQRSAAAGVVPSFERLVVPRQVRTSPVSDEERTKRDFYRILWDYSDGNPQVALHFWRESLYRRSDDETVHVRLFSGPSAGQLDDLPATFYFVLRTIVQLELAVEEDVVTCTDLSAAEVADALRAARVHGYIKENAHLFEIDLQWYRAIISILRRKHLLLL
ncbi:MAG: AAA family ATPase [Myxococcales bacterium]|nr:AAA family ATPase [Myxococcales bacterium]